MLSLFSLIKYFKMALLKYSKCKLRALYADGHIFMIMYDDLVDDYYSTNICISYSFIVQQCHGNIYYRF